MQSTLTLFSRIRLWGFTSWSIVTLIACVPVWILVFRSSALSRIVDGGIFLSASTGIARGLDLYEEVWDNKDALFFVGMAIASQINVAAPYFMDLLWFVIASIGSVLIAHRIMSADRAVFMGAVITPFLLLGPTYVPGWTNTPGTALVLFAVGLLMQQKGIAGGLIIGFLAFTKLILWPLSVAAILISMMIPTRRRTGLRALAAMGGAMGGIVMLLALFGWLPGAWEAVSRNRQYAADVAAYFGYEPTISGRWSRALIDWPSEFQLSVAIAGLAVIVIAGFWLMNPTFRSPDRTLLSVWSILVLVGMFLVVGLTYVWSHHGQALTLICIIAAIMIAGSMPSRWPFVAWLVLVVIGAWLMSGWGSWSAMRATFDQRLHEFDSKVAQIAEVPTDALLLNSIPQKNFTYARLGSNDDRGFLTAVRPDAALECPQFHLYDFSPDEAFLEIRECVEGVDVILITDAFVAFGNGGKAGVVQPVLKYVDQQLSCLRVDDRRICTRK